MEFVACKTHNVRLLNSTLILVKLSIDDYDYYQNNNQMYSDERLRVALSFMMSFRQQCHA